jgi:hypothetical protein
MEKENAGACDGAFDVVPDGDTVDDPDRAGR